ncbi:XrtA system polysaccharide deacetylase [Desulfospira joergensenii]|uniref:XrtA system polysaccharide deacetylase n=1 Tax=Desulfospira joergensenii TaxID=53329 RepID=UPI0004175462|nr:XrtA system polysaccharide deacetylase [Desulfospira joergensenii]
MTFDVEDWFQVENFKPYIKFSTWSSFELRVANNTFKILDLLDSFPFKPKATFFILGWIAQRVPDLVKEIHKRGHEVASHGFYHHLCNDLSPEELIRDLKKSKDFLESLVGEKIYGFRAPSFVVSDKVLGLIKAAGYFYDSSFNSFSGHDRYGIIDLSGAKKQGVLYRINSDFCELPVSNLEIKGRVFPLGGGGYFRLLPFSLFKLGMEFVLKKDGAFIFYSHPWEYDPSQPRVELAAKTFKFRHYVNLHKTEKRLNKLLKSFSEHRFITCKDYVKRNSC